MIHKSTRGIIQRFLNGPDSRQPELLKRDALLRASGKQHSEKPPLQKLRVRVDTIFDAVKGRLQLPLERLLKTVRRRICCSIFSKHLFGRHIKSNLLYCHSGGLAAAGPERDPAVISQNRKRLFDEELAWLFFERIKTLVDGCHLTYNEHSVSTAP
ncbi:MAG TPA: hypothetical protein PKI28_01085 [Accumulibacter sp.]|nr:hypothetical protein [Accumulibacter sp.]HMX22562.1 hypothetical protein [Accumulibacter sp.]HNC16929.1 hypothetical protein [Accumulibacter sp.]HNL76248.1 hypothetical protein [Accumulibacter sp.]HNO56269.1 hypothetical protein [Accumulibacter sp.]